MDSPAIWAMVAVMPLPVQVLAREIEGPFDRRRARAAPPGPVSRRRGRAAT